tara:strand:+ start:1854 stop:2081 length:228 start_codon:yes stop_codon:yes gene_type:complete
MKTFIFRIYDRFCTSLRYYSMQFAIFVGSLLTFKEIFPAEWAELLTYLPDPVQKLAGVGMILAMWWLRTKPQAKG